MAATTASSAALTPIAPPLTLDALSANAAAGAASVPSILHAIEPPDGLLDALREAHPGWVVLGWSIAELDGVARRLLPAAQASLADAPDASKRLVYPFVVLWAFGGVAWPPEARPRCGVQPLLAAFPTCILFFWLESAAALERERLAFGVNGRLLAAAARLNAIGSLLDACNQHVHGDYTEQMHNGLLNQFVRAALNGSKSGAVQLLSDRYASDDATYGLFERGDAHADALEHEDALRELLAAPGAAPYAMPGTAMAKAFAALAATAEVPLREAPAGCTLLCLDACVDDPQRPVDAQMDVAQALLAAKPAAGSHVLLRHEVDAIARMALKALGATATVEGHLATLWRV